MMVSFIVGENPGIIFGPINQHLGRNLIKEMNYNIHLVAKYKY
jgi:hypothetical protein